MKNINSAENELFDIDAAIKVCRDNNKTDLAKMLAD